jgi:hypothetical protein
MERSVFAIKRTYTFWRWTTLLLVAAMATFPVLLVIDQGRYTNGNLLALFCLIAALLLLMWTSYYYQQTTAIQLTDSDFSFRKVGRKIARYPYNTVLAHNERLRVEKNGTFQEFTVYLKDNWFAIRSNEFTDYDYVKEQFVHYGQSVSYQNVLTVTERTGFRWLIGGMALLIGVSIGFGFALHNPADPNPAQLIALTDVAEQINVNRNKGRLISVTIRLRAHPTFYFEVSRRQFDNPPDGLQAAIRLKEPITLLIRQSEFRKKLTKTEPLTFGDKYDGYKQILVFGVRQGDWIDLQTSQPVHEPTHTNPLLRTLFLGLLLVFCWAGWVHIDGLEVLGDS